MRLSIEDRAVQDVAFVSISARSREPSPCVSERGTKSRGSRPPSEYSGEQAEGNRQKPVEDAIS